GAAEVGYGPVRTVLTAEATLVAPPPDALGYGMRWRVGDEALPFLETHWARYAVFADAPLFRTSYAQGVRSYLPTVNIERDGPVTETGWIRGHAVLPAGHRGLAALVSSSAGVTTSGHAGGGFFLGPHQPGVVSLFATAAGHLGGPVEALVEAGVETVTRVDLRAVPILDAGAWSPHGDKLVVAVEIDHFDSAPVEASLTVRTEEQGLVLGAWTGAAEGGSVEIVFDSPQPDGMQLVPSGSVDDGDVVEGPVATIDTTPPTAPTITWTGVVCGSPLEVQLAAADDLAPVTGYEVSLDGQLWTTLDATGKGALTAPASMVGLVEAQARAENAAGLWSEIATAPLCTVETSPLPDVTVATDVAETPATDTPIGPIGDTVTPPTDQGSTDSASEASSEAQGDGSDGGCAGGEPRAPVALAILLAAWCLRQRRWTIRCRRQGAEGVVRSVFVRHRQ
ncbi:MAG: hypothetical protein QF464_17680, partial [Myxococcota bacterium]|nr:hypothetical protein [Myxococcota bacterium]